MAANLSRFQCVNTEMVLVVESLLHERQALQKVKSSILDDCL